MMFNEFAERNSARISFDQFAAIVTSDQSKPIDANTGIAAASNNNSGSPHTPEAQPTTTRRTTRRK
jgi:hypothetical protein